MTYWRRHVNCFTRFRNTRSTGTGWLVATVKRVVDNKYEKMPTERAWRFWETAVEHLVQWITPAPHKVYVFQLSDDQAQSLPHPSEFVFAVSSWLQRLVWPEVITETDESHGLSYWFYSFYCSRSARQILSTLWASMVASMMTLLFCYFSCVKLIATIKRCSCKAPACFPGSKPTSGFVGRPQLVQPEVFVFPSFLRVVLMSVRILLSGRMVSLLIDHNLLWFSLLLQSRIPHVWNGLISRLIGAILKFKKANST